MNFQIEVHSEECLEAVEQRKVGVGQLFRYLNVLPTFRLLKAGRDTNGSLWREYTLSCPQLTCTFTEVFSPGFLGYFPF